eukprot:3515187-Rhodomonas_salina.1
MGRAGAEQEAAVREARREAQRERQQVHANPLCLVQTPFVWSKPPLSGPEPLCLVQSPFVCLEWTPLSGPNPFRLIHPPVV